jgi:hypothetical protein
MGVQLGEFLGAIIGQAWKIAGPVILADIRQAVKLAILDARNTADVSQPNADLERLWDQGNSRPAGGNPIPSTGGKNPGVRPG